MDTIRFARAADLADLHAIFYEQETAGHRDPPPRGPLPALYQHELETGALCVAERDGRVMGFAGSITRGATEFLAFVSTVPAAFADVRRYLPPGGTLF